MEKRTYTNDLLNAAKQELPWERLRNKSILVLGSTGLIGGAVIDLLMSRVPLNFHVYAGFRNYEWAKKRFAKYLHSPFFHLQEVDVTLPIKDNKVFHYMIDAASGAHPKAYAVNPVGVIRANVMGVDNLLSYGKEHGMEKFVYVSSGEVYGEGDGRVFTEDYSGFVDCATVRACYPSSKRAAETLCVSYVSQYKLDISIARPSHVYGPYFTPQDSRAYAQFLRNVIQGENITLKSTGDQFRSWCYAVDCAIALLYILFKGKSGAAYNVADESSNVSIREFADIIAGIGNRKVVLSLPDQTEQKGFTVVRKAVFDTSRLKGLGWNCTGTLRENLLVTFQELTEIH